MFTFFGRHFVFQQKYSSSSPFRLSLLTISKEQYISKNNIIVLNVFILSLIANVTIATIAICLLNEIAQMNNPHLYFIIL